MATTDSERPERRSPSQPVVEPVTLLLVDDRPENLIALEATLKCREYSLLSADSGARALELLEQNEVALVLLDIQMPGMDGYETAERIKSNPRTAHIPVMMVTAIFKEDPEIRKGYDLGVVDYIGKPFDIEVLRRKVGIYTQLHQHRRQIRFTEERQKVIDAELVARREELKHRSAQITTLLESVKDPVFVVWDGQVRESNTPALRLFGFENYDQMEMDFDSFLKVIRLRNPETGQPMAPAEHPYHQAMKGEKSLGQFIVAQRETNQEVVVRCAAHPVRFGDKVLGVVMVHEPLPA